MYMQDNTSCHKAKIVMDFMASKEVIVINRPSQSADMTPIENLCAIIKRERHQKFQVTISKSGLIKQIFVIWDEVDMELCQTLFDSLSYI